METQGYSAAERLFANLANFGLYPRDFFELFLVIITLLSLAMTAVHMLLHKRSNNYTHGRLIILLRPAHHFFGFFFGLLFMRSVLFEPFRVTHSDLTPEIRTGEHLLVKRFQYAIKLPMRKSALIALAKPLRGDIVLSRYSQPNNQVGLFRIIGLPGEHVRYNRKTGEVFIDGNPLPQVSAVNSGVAQRKDINVMQEDLGTRVILVSKNTKIISRLGTWLPDEGRLVPVDSYFGMLDVRDACCDSRELGVVTLENIVGKAYLVYMGDANGIVFDNNRFLK